MNLCYSLRKITMDISAWVTCTKHYDASPVKNWPKKRLIWSYKRFFSIFYIFDEKNIFRGAGGIRNGRRLSNIVHGIWARNQSCPWFPKVSFLFSKKELIFFKYLSHSYLIWPDSLNWLVHVKLAAETIGHLCSQFFFNFCSILHFFWIKFKNCDINEIIMTINRNMVKITNMIIFVSKCFFFRFTLKFRFSRNEK